MDEKIDGPIHVFEDSAFWNAVAHNLEQNNALYRRTVLGEKSSGNKELTSEVEAEDGHGR